MRHILTGAVGGLGLPVGLPVGLHDVLDGQFLCIGLAPNRRNSVCHQCLLGGKPFTNRLRHGLIVRWVIDQEVVGQGDKTEV